MYYCLDKGYSLCSWKGVPYVLRKDQTGECIVLKDKDVYLLLYQCNGKNNIDLPQLNEQQQIFVDELVKAQIILPYVEPHPLDGSLPSHVYSNYYRKSIHWSITGRCNYRCRHCFQSAAKGELGQPTLEQLLDEIRQFADCGISEVSITGGEPLIRHDFFNIIDALLEKNIRVTTIYSNGALVNQNFLDNFKERNMKPAFQISFDGVGWHDWMRGIPGAEKLAVDAIKLLKDNEFPVSCAMALCRENIPSMVETARFLESIGCASLKIQRCFPQGEWRMEAEHYIGDNELIEIYINFLDQIVSNKIHMPIQMEGIYCVKCGDDGKYKVSIPFDKKVKNEKVDYRKLPSCGITCNNFFVGPNGAVVPCMNMCGCAAEKLFPNLFQMPLKKILTDSPYLKYAEVKKGEILNHNPQCIDCEYANRCGGGSCRAMAIGDQKTDYLCFDEFTCYLFKSGWFNKLTAKANEVARAPETSEPTEEQQLQI